MNTVDIRIFTIQFDVAYRLQDLATRPPIVIVDITMTTLYIFVCNYFDIIVSPSLFSFSYIMRVIGNRMLERLSRMSRFGKIRGERKFR